MKEITAQKNLIEFLSREHVIDDILIVEKFQTRVPSKDVIINGTEFLLFYQMPFGVIFPESGNKHYVNGKTGKIAGGLDDSAEVYNYVIDDKVYAKASQGRGFHQISREESKGFETPKATYPVQYNGEEFIPVFIAKRAHRKTDEQPIFHVKSANEIVVLDEIDKICYYDDQRIIGMSYKEGKMLIDSDTGEKYQVPYNGKSDSVESLTLFEDQLYGVTNWGVVFNLESGQVVAQYGQNSRMNKITQINGELAVISYDKFAYPLEQNSRVYKLKSDNSLKYLLNIKPNADSTEVDGIKDLTTGSLISLARNPIKKAWNRGIRTIWDVNSSFIDTETTYGVSLEGEIYNFLTGQSVDLKEMHPSLYNICGIPSTYVDGCLKSVDSGKPIVNLPLDEFPNARFLVNDGFKVHFETWNKEEQVETHYVMDLTSRLR